MSNNAFKSIIKAMHIIGLFRGVHCFILLWDSFSNKNSRIMRGCLKKEKSEEENIFSRELISVTIL